MELCRPPGMLDLSKPNTLMDVNTELCANQAGRSTSQLWVESCREV